MSYMMWSRWKCKSLKKNLLFHIRNAYRYDSMACKYWRSLWLGNTILSKRTSGQIIAQYAMTNTMKIVITSTLFNFLVLKMVNSLKYNFCQDIVDISKIMASCSQLILNFGQICVSNTWHFFHFGLEVRSGGEDWALLTELISQSFMW